MADITIRAFDAKTQTAYDEKWHDNGDGTYSRTSYSAGDGLPVGAATDANTRGALTNRSGTITAGTTAQNAAAANTARKYVLLLNPDTATEDLWYSFDATAVIGAPSLCLHPGDSVSAGPGDFIPTGALSVIAVTTAHAYTCKEG